jgi:hypothetical protein
MKRNYSTGVTGWLFIAGALMFWGGWVLLPVHIGTFFRPDDFAAVHAHLHMWIWLYRVHLFGFLVAVMAFAALAAVLTDSEARVVVWPGVTVAVVGLATGCLAAAFYYHHGAWGALQTAGQPLEKLRGHVDALRLDTEYITCLVRFGRVFFGLGLVVLAAGLIKWRILPLALGMGAVLLGSAAMALTMAFPDNLEFYAPVFHLNSLWLLAMGLIILRSGLRLGKRSCENNSQLHVE